MVRRFAVGPPRYRTRLWVMFCRDGRRACRRAQLSRAAAPAGVVRAELREGDA